MHSFESLVSNYIYTVYDSSNGISNYGAKSTRSSPTSLGKMSPCVFSPHGESGFHQKGGGGGVPIKGGISLGGGGFP